MMRRRKGLIRIGFGVLVIVVFLNMLRMAATVTAQEEEEAVTVAATTAEKVKVKVGVVLDLNVVVGKMGLSCISMALADFYSSRSHYKTRLILNTIDSNGTVVDAAAAALDLIKKDEVQAIIGPTSSMQANFMIDVGEKTQVPIISYSATRPSLTSHRSSFFFRVAQNDSSQVKAIGAVVKAFKWRQVVPIYSDNEFGDGIIPYLIDALQEVDADVPYQSIISPAATDAQITSELHKLMKMPTRVFVVHMLTRHASRFFTKANEIGMMKRGYVWIITDAIANELDLIEPSAFEAMQGVVGIRTYVPRTKKLDSFKHDWSNRFQRYYPNIEHIPELDVFGLWAYDAAWALAMAVEKAGTDNLRYNPTNVTATKVNSSNYLFSLGVNENGMKLRDAFSNVTFRGLAGEFSLINGQLQPSLFEIVNLVGNGRRNVGFWSPETGLTRKLQDSERAKGLRSIIWPGEPIHNPKGWQIPIIGKKLKVGVPVKDGFWEFVRVVRDYETNATIVKGYCIDVFKAVIEALPYKVDYEFIPAERSTAAPGGSYNELTYQLFLGMETIFISQDLWEIIEEDYEVPAVEEDEATSERSADQEKEFKKNKKRNALALRLIQQGVSKSIFPRIFGIKKAKDAWEILQKEFKGTEKVISIKLQSLWRDFDNLAMKESENVRDYFSRVSQIINQMKCYGETIPEKRINEKVLRSLPPKFNHVVAAIEESKDVSKLTIFELMGSLQAHEERLNKSPSQSVEQVFHTKLNFGEKKTYKSNSKKWWNPTQKKEQGQRDKGKWQSKSGNSDSHCIICKKSNHESKDCYFRCTKCRIPNHSQKDCWFQNKKEKDEANFTKEDEGEKLFCCTIDQSQSQSKWYLDSGCSNHMTGNKDFFVKIDRSFSSQVQLGDGKMQKAEGKGVIVVHTKKGDTRYISDVLYVPGITQNLLSVGQLLQNGYAVNFDDGKCIILDKKNDQIVAKVDMSVTKVFPLLMPLEENFALKSESPDISHLWHLRYGHLYSKSLRTLKQKNMVIGLPTIEDDGKICEGCIYGKIHRLPFPKTSWRAKSPLELVHSDICGPTRTSSLTNKRYYILFVDDFTRMMWIYFLNEKSEAFASFLQFKALAENQSGKKIKTLRTDRGGEFIYKPFMDYCKENGIMRQLTVRHSPQQNGVAERKNRTIVEMARSMLKAKDLPNNLWAEAVNTAVYILNRCPTKAVEDKTPFEAWNKKKPVIDHLKVFGCLAYSLVPSREREKFDKKGAKYLFIGYSDESKGYRLLNPKTEKLFISRDVIFDEMATWDFENYNSQPSQHDEIIQEPDWQPVSQNLGSPRSCPSTPARSPIEATSNQDNSESPPRRMRSLQDIYASSEHFAMFACEPQSFDDAAKEDVWNKDMDEEIASVERNKTWEIQDLNEKLCCDDNPGKADPKSFRSLVGSLIYLTNTRPYIMYPVSVISRYMNEPSKNHYTAAKRVLRYLQGTRKHGLKYVHEKDCQLVGYTDSDWAGSLDDRKSTSGYVFCLGSNAISWSSRKQQTVALSSSEAEYTAATEASCEVVWLRRILKDLQIEQVMPTKIFCDNMSTIAMTKNPVFHARSKHIELRHHYIRDLVNKEEIYLEFINTNDQPADMFTKAVTLEKFEKFKKFLKITN